MTRDYSRRDFIAASGAGVGLALASSALPRGVFAKEPSGAGQRFGCDDVLPEALGPMRARFVAWLESKGTAVATGISPLVYYYVGAKDGRPEQIHPMVSAKAILFNLQLGNVARATAMGHALLRWQQRDAGGVAFRSWGAFPSAIREEPAGKWVHSAAYYAGDNLVVLEALLALFAATRDRLFLESAIGVGTWVCDVMCRGVGHGVWAEDYGAPMEVVRLDGAFGNKIPAHVPMLWIASLGRLARLTGEKGYGAQLEKAAAFYLRGQANNGAFYDHYDPGYPAVAYNRARWMPYSPGKIIGDNVLRSALGACRLGDVVAARRVFAWLKPEAGAVAAYLNIETGGAGFLPTDAVYYDVVCSGLYRSLCQWLGERKAAEEAVRFAAARQDADGGFTWGVRKDAFASVDGKQATLTGLWSVADFSRGGGG
jgi:hypothetical protein